MARKYFFIVGVIVIIIGLHAFSWGETQGNLYKDDEYKFEIKFPAGWKIKDKKGDNKRVVAIESKTSSTIGISIKRLSGDLDVKDYSHGELDELLSDSIEVMKSKFPGAKIIEKGFRYLSNKKAIYFKSAVSYKTIDLTFNLITVQYATISNGKFYLVEASTPADLFNIQEASINKSIASFVLLNELSPVSKDFESFSEHKLVVYRDDKYKFVFQYPETWLAVPETNAGTRIKIVNDNGHGDSDCGVNVQEFKTSLKRSDDSLTLQAFEKVIKSSFHNAAISKSGKTYLGNRKAFYAIASYTFRSFEMEVPVQTLVIQTIKDRNVYLFFCRTTPDHFDKMLPVFQLLAASFTISP